jgi:hypothetical protein
VTCTIHLVSRNMQKPEFCLCRSGALLANLKQTLSISAHTLEQIECSHVNQGRELKVLNGFMRRS